MQVQAFRVDFKETMATTNEMVKQNKQGIQHKSSRQMIKETVERILESRRISRSDQQLLMAALLSKNSLSLEDQGQVNRIFDRLQTGLIRVVD